MGKGKSHCPSQPDAIPLYKASFPSLLLTKPHIKPPPSHFFSAERQAAPRTPQGQQEPKSTQSIATIHNHTHQEHKEEDKQRGQEGETTTGGHHSRKGQQQSHLKPTTSPDNKLRQQVKKMGRNQAQDWATTPKTGSDTQPQGCGLGTEPGSRAALGQAGGLGTKAARGRWHAGRGGGWRLSRRHGGRRRKARPSRARGVTRAQARTRERG
uniref:PH01B035L11.16 protein n=1 Tax=Phyllostachys edulis TaxID=38705 RepID=L0P1Q1_PHYED|nr:PH01B035L11.16 [Phyllostachys edulis]